MTEDAHTSPAQRLIGGAAPVLVDLTDRILFGEVWSRPELSPRDRSMITCASLLTSGSTEQLRSHLQRARDHGCTVEELVEMITHLAFYAGWPKSMSAIAVAKDVFAI